MVRHLIKPYYNTTLSFSIDDDSPYLHNLTYVMKLRGVTHTLTVGQSSCDRCQSKKSKDKDVHLCLVNGQGHYFRPTVNDALYFHNRF